MLLAQIARRISNCPMTTSYILNGQLRVSGLYVRYLSAVSDNLVEISLPPKVAHGSVKLLNPKTWKVIDR